LPALLIEQFLFQQAKKMKKIAITITLFISAFTAGAQTATTAAASQQVNMNLTDAIAITFVNSGTTTGSAVTMSFKTVKNYSSGISSATQQFKVQSNKNFIISVNTNAANFSYTGTEMPAPVMPVNILSMKVTANATGGSLVSPFNNFGSLASTSQDVINNGSYGGNQTFSVKYKAMPGFSYPAGTYTTTVVFTATQP